MITHECEMGVMLAGEPQMCGKRAVAKLPCYDLPKSDPGAARSSDTHGCTPSTTTRSPRPRACGRQRATSTSWCPSCRSLGNRMGEKMTGEKMIEKTEAKRLVERLLDGKSATVLHYNLHYRDQEGEEQFYLLQDGSVFRVTDEGVSSNDTVDECLDGLAEDLGDMECRLVLDADEGVLPTAENFFERGTWRVVGAEEIEPAPEIERA